MENTKISEFYNSTISETWEAQRLKTREMMISDIVKSIKIERVKISMDPFREPFSFEDLVNSAKKNIWVGKSK